MEKTIIAKYTATEEKLIFFAEAKGWTAKVPNPDYDASVEGSEEEIDNPVTVEEFVTTWGNKMLTEQLSAPMVDFINKQSREAVIQQIDLVNKDVESGLVVEIK